MIDWIGLDWIGLDWIGLDWISNPYEARLRTRILNVSYIACVYVCMYTTGITVYLLRGFLKIKKVRVEFFRKKIIIYIKDT